MESNRIILRKWIPEDANVLVENLNNEKMSLTLGTEYPYTYENATRYIEDAIRNNKEKYAIVYKETMQVIGGCGLHIMDRTASGNMWIASEYRGMGIGTEAAFLLVEHCFKDLQLERMENVFFEGNEASRKMQEKVGAVVCEEKEAKEINGKNMVKNKTIITKENFEKVLASLKRN